MFIEPDEHLIVMEDDYFHPFNDDDLGALKLAGIRTILVPHAIQRNIIKPRHAGFKNLMPFYYSGESFVDLVESKQRVKAWARVCSRVSSKMQAVFGLPDGGEFLWDAMMIDDFPLSDDEIINFIVEIQSVLCKPHREIWLSMHNFMGSPLNWNNVRLPKLYEALRKEFPYIPFYSLQYVHFSCGGTPTPVEMQRKITSYAKEFNIRFFVGPDYCEGLNSSNFDAALEQGAWGFVCSPTHSENPIRHDHIEPWMVETLRDADKKLKEHYGNNTIQPFRKW